MNSKQAVERMREFEKKISEAKVEFFAFGIKTDEEAINFAKKKWKQEAKEIYEKFKDGCNEMWMTGVGAHYPCAGECPNCKEIKEIWEKINENI